MLQRKIGDAGFSRAEGPADGRKVSAVKDTDSERHRRETTVSEYEKRSLASAMGTSLVGYLATKRFGRKLTSRVTGSWGNRSRTSNTETHFPKEPTYRMEPKKAFCPGAVRDIIKATLEERLEGFQYSAQQGAILSKILTEEIKEKVKTLNLDRYKIVCHVAIGEKVDQCMIVTSRCLWDSTVDNSASYTYDVPSLYCTVTVYAVYTE